MRYKYNISVEGYPTCGVILDDASSVLMIGGKARARKVLEEILGKFFDGEEIAFKYVQKNKIRYWVKSVTWTKFDQFISFLKASGVIVEETKVLGRVMI